jgi:hypothetical protein
VGGAYVPTLLLVGMHVPLAFRPDVASEWEANRRDPSAQRTGLGTTAERISARCPCSQRQWRVCWLGANADDKLAIDSKRR